MAQTTFNPSLDGRVLRSVGGAGEAWGTIRAGAGTSTSTTSPNNLVYFDTGGGTSSNQYAQITRSIFLFDTSSIPDSDTIIAATLRIYITSTANEFSGASSANSAVVVCSSNPASNSSLANSDYGTLGTTDFGRSGNQSGISTSAYLEIALNASGLAAISKTGITKLGIRYGWDIDNTTTGITWGAAKSQAVIGNYSSAASNKPELVVTHTPAANGNFFSLF